jgi:hypothetical protein
MSGFYFGLMRDENELLQLEAFLLSKSMNYPYYENWVKKVCIPDLRSEWKKSILAFYGTKGDWQLVGNAIYQLPKEKLNERLHSTLQLKNMRVEDGFRREGIASFLIKQAEKQARLLNLSNIILDFRSDRKDILGLFIWHGYNVLMETELYDDNNIDTIMIKTIRKQEEKSFLIH